VAWQRRRGNSDGDLQQQGPTKQLYIKKETVDRPANAGAAKKRGLPPSTLKID